jgi:hypothetical protein
MMTKYLTLFLFVFFSAFVSYGQALGDYYVSISMDNVQGGRLKFISDTTVELSSMPRHMSPSLKTVYKYISNDTTIEILPSTDREIIRPPEIYVRQSVLETKSILTKIAGGFIDYNRSLIYVRQRDFPANPDITYIIDGKAYRQDMGVTDGYGLIRKSPKKNKALQKRLKTIDKDNCTIEIVRGLAAYERFGIDKVYGVIVITTKK